MYKKPVSGAPSAELTPELLGPGYPVPIYTSQLALAKEGRRQGSPEQGPGRTGRGSGRQEGSGQECPGATETKHHTPGALNPEMCSLPVLRLGTTNPVGQGLPPSRLQRRVLLASSFCFQLLPSCWPQGGWGASPW